VVRNSKWVAQSVSSPTVREGSFQALPDGRATDQGIGKVASFENNKSQISNQK